MNSDRNPFHYLHHLVAFLAGNADPHPLSPWLASLEFGDLDHLATSIEDHMKGDHEMKEHLMSDIMAVVVHVMTLEKMPTTSFTCSLKDLDNCLFALGLCAAFEQMRRAGVARNSRP